jgi:hypothetical protein
MFAEIPKKKPKKKKTDDSKLKNSDERSGDGTKSQAGRLISRP